MDKFTIPILKFELEKRNLPTKGAKAVLFDRLRRAVEAEGKDPSSYVSEFLVSKTQNHKRKANEVKSKEPTAAQAGDVATGTGQVAAAAADDASSATLHNVQQPLDEDEDDGDAVADSGQVADTAARDAHSAASEIFQRRLNDSSGQTSAVPDRVAAGTTDDPAPVTMENFQREIEDDVRSVGSRRSNASRFSSASVASMRAMEAAKRAELQTRASFLEDKRRLEDEERRLEEERRRRQLKLRREMEDLELKTKLAEAEARERAILEVELEDEQNMQLPCTQAALDPTMPVFLSKGKDRSADLRAHMIHEEPSSERRRPSEVAGFSVQHQAAGVTHKSSDVKRSRSGAMTNNEHAAYLNKALSKNIVGSEEYMKDKSSSIEPGRFAGEGHWASRLDVEQREITSEKESVSKQNPVLEMLLEQQERSSLPKLEVPRFSGSVTDYAQFIRSFEVRIESKIRSDDERLSYLDHYLIGEPKDVIKGCLLMPSGSGYAKARKLLDSRYGDSCRTVTNLVSQLSRWPQIRPDDVNGLDRFSIFLDTCHCTVQGTAPSSVELDQPNILRTAMDKLPDHMQDRWRRHALKISSHEGTQPPNSVCFGDFVSFVQDEVKILLDPRFGKHSIEIKTARAMQPKPSGRTTTGNVLATNASSDMECWYCQGSHYLQDCTALRAKPMEERKEFFMKESLCFGCSRKGHRVSQCRSRRSCEICQRRHLTVLHQTAETRDDHSHVTNSQSPGDFESMVKERSAGTVSAASKMQSGMPIVPVKVQVEGGRPVSTYAFIDSGSSACFCTESLLAELQTSGKATQLTLETVNPHATKLESSVVTGLQVSDIEESMFIRLPPVYTLNKIPVDKEDVPKAEHLRTWSHLDAVDMPDLECDVGLMIGSNVPEAIEPWEVLHGKPGDPFAIKTKLGWTVWGPSGGNSDAGQNIRFNRVQVKEAEVHDLFVKMYNEEYKDDISDNKGMSQEDIAWMKKVESSCKVSGDDHYEISLPFRSSKPNLPNNHQMAVSRLGALKRKLSADLVLHQQYNSFMKDMLDHKYAERVPDSELKKVDGQVWYIPHHGVRQAKKPDKVRVVFDCPAKFHDVSLNESLLQGPDLTNDLLDVLLRFRENQVAFTADIEAMFYQVRVPEEDRDFLRFLWWPDGDLSKSPATYRMTVHLFGACSSPSCANFALRKTAQDHGDEYDDQVSKTIRENFYVDDCLKSTNDVDTAINLAHDLKDLCRRGGFNLTKIVSNDRKLISSFDPEDRGKNLKSVDLSRENLPDEKALGVYWNVEEDVMGVKVSDIKKSTTRRGVLSTIGSVFDPLGLAAPLLLEGRKLLQDLCRLELGWDQPLPLREEVIWQNWLKKLPEMERLQLKRCIVPQHFGDVVDTQLHHFADASETGIGVVSYVRLTNQHGQVHCSFLHGKSKVAPLKTVTIPRLELTAAVLAVKVGKRLEEAMEMLPNSVTFWSDSTTVLSYIENTKTRFHIFVANRLKIIHEQSSPEQWKYVPGELNPADEGSRGYQTPRWLKGPQFLWMDRSTWPAPSRTEAVQKDDPEVKASSCATNVSPQIQTHERPRQDPVLEMCEHFSSWHKAKKAVAWMLRFKAFMLVKTSLKKATLISVKKGPLTVGELEDAEIEIIKHVQEQHFEKEMSQRRNSSSSRDGKTVSLSVGRSSKLRKLNPMVENGVLKVGGRLKRSTLNQDMKHPMILPNTGQVSKLIVEDVHRRLGHQGREHVLGELREKFWIVQGTSLVRKVLRKCVVCRKLMSPPVTQKMSDLPEERMTSDLPPFTNSGVDLFGPFYVKRGRAEIKLYGVVFTCMASRAVHLEVADSLSTNAFINALRRFIARRGEIKSLRSDRGTNFVGAERELAEMIREWNEGQIKETMLQSGIQWTFNPAGASHFGGVWERQIRTIRKILSATLSEQTIREDNLRTLLCEIEAIINSRPLTTVSTDPEDAAPLTPNHLLHRRAGLLLPPGIFQSSDLYSRRWWRQVQYIADLFWKRWRKEYLAVLQQRNKWTKTERNLKVDDVVIIVDDNLPRSQWRLGRIEEVYPATDGLVRKVKVKAGQSSLYRPVSKVVLLWDD